jgi:hypothetical protein
MTQRNLPFFELLKKENLRPESLRKEEVRKVLGGKYRPEDFGALADGVTDDGPAIQLAIDAAAANGGGTILFTSGETYKVSQELNITTSNMHVEMTGATIDATEIPLSNTVAGSHGLFNVKGETILYADLVGNIDLHGEDCQVTSSSNIQIGDIIYFRRSGETWYETGTEVIERWMMNRIKDISGTTITFDYASPIDLDGTTYTYLMQGLRPISNITFRGGNLYGGGVRPFPADDDNVGNGSGIIAYNFDLGVTDVDIEIGYVEGFQGFVVRSQLTMNITVHGGTMRGYLDSDDDVVEGTNSGFYGFFTAFCTNIVFRDCSSYRTRHMQDGSFTENGSISNLRAYRNHRPPFGSHAGANNYTFHNLFTNSSYGGIQWRGLNWTVIGCHLTALTFTTGSNACYDESGTAGATKTGTFIGNTFHGQRTGLMLQGRYSRIFSSGNTFRSQVSGGDYAPLLIYSKSYESLTSVGDFFNPDAGNYGWLVSNNANTERTFTSFKEGTYLNCASNPGRFFAAGSNCNLFWTHNYNLDNSNAPVTDSLGTGHSILTPNYADAGVVI